METESDRLKLCLWTDSNKSYRKAINRNWCNQKANPALKDRDSTVPKRGSVFIGLMTPDGAIWSRYQRAVLMR